MPSQWYTALQNEISRLDLTYLPQGAHPAQVLPSDEEHEKIRAYFVFAHAAIESYLEERALAAATAALDDYRQSATIRKSLLSLSIYWLPAKNAADDIVKIREKKDEPTIQTVNKIVALYKGNVLKNHGIRRDNLAALLEPLGFELSTIDAVWLAEIDTFGQMRGLAAHQAGAAFKARYQTNIADARKKVRYILEGSVGQAGIFPGLTDIDTKFDNL